MHIAHEFTSSSILHTLPPLSELQYILILDYIFANHSLDLHISIIQQYCTCTSHQTQVQSVKQYWVRAKCTIYIFRKNTSNTSTLNTHKMYTSAYMRRAHCSEAQAGRSHYVQMCEHLSRPIAPLSGTTSGHTQESKHPLENLVFSE